jgi:hypothetical protein
MAASQSTDADEQRSAVLEQTLQQQRPHHRKGTAGAQIQRCFRERLEEF